MLGFGHNVLIIVQFFNELFLTPFGIKTLLDKHLQAALTADTCFQSMQWTLQDVAVTAR